MTTAPGIHNITVYAGATLEYLIGWKSAGVMVDLTGYTACLRVYVHAIGECFKQVITLTTANGGITLGGTAGTIMLNMTAAETSALTILRCAYILEVTSSGGVVTRLLEGLWTVSPRGEGVCQ